MFCTLKCSDAIDWVTRRASDLAVISPAIPEGYSLTDLWVTWPYRD